MIESLHVENIALLKRLDVDFRAGMTVLTGETGAGKSLMIDCLNLLLGGRADRELIRNGESRAEVSAVFGHLSENTLRILENLGFSVEDDSLMLSRTMTHTSSSARLNGRAVPLSLLREISASLFNIHGQNDNQQLLDPKNHIHLLDTYLGLGDLQDAYAESYRQVMRIRNELEALKKDGREQARLAEMLRYQVSEIDAAKLKVGEEDALTQLAQRLRAAEQIEKCRALAEKALLGGEKGRGAVYLTERAASALETVSDTLPEAETLAKRLENIRYELEDIASALSDLDSFDGEDVLAKLDRTEERLDKISKLKRKYGSTEEEILAFRNNSALRLETLEHADEKTADLEAELVESEKRAAEAARTLSEKRRSGAVGLTEAVTETLRFLDMPKVRFEVDFRRAEDFRPYGLDEVEFLISANPGEPLYPMAKIASGGELARIMLSLKNVLNECDGVNTVIFDEIDTGISGKTSRKVGIKLKEIGKQSQVICVTHSAQIASLAHHHLYISKQESDGRVCTAVRELDLEGRTEEIARILGGIEITDAQRQAAREMIAEGESY